MATNTTTLLYVVTRTPYESLRPLETIDAILVGAVFDLAVGVLFINDGVWQLVSGQSSTAGSKNIAQQLSVLPGYDVASVWVCEASLAERGLKVENLCLPACAVSLSAQRALLAEHEIVLND